MILDLGHRSDVSLAFRSESVGPTLPLPVEDTSLAGLWSHVRYPRNYGSLAVTLRYGSSASPATFEATGVKMNPKIGGNHHRTVSSDCTIRTLVAPSFRA